MQNAVSDRFLGKSCRVGVGNLLYPARRRLTPGSHHLRNRHTSTCRVHRACRCAPGEASQATVLTVPYSLRERPGTDSFTRHRGYFSVSCCASTVWRVSQFVPPRPRCRSLGAISFIVMGVPPPPRPLSQDLRDPDRASFLGGIIQARMLGLTYPVQGQRPPSSSLRQTGIS